jgi:YVTN family beta-propeller protein
MAMRTNPIKCLIAATQIAVLAAAGSASAAKGEVYVADEGANTVSVIDAASFNKTRSIESRKQTAQIAVGKGPAQVGFTPDGRLGLVSLSQENQVVVIDPASRKVIRKVRVGTVPIQLYATPDSRLLLVANQGTREKPGSSVGMIDLDTHKVVGGAHPFIREPAGSRSR